MRRTALAAVLACALLLAVTIVSPAVGGPSIGSVASTAKKALKQGKAAKRTASAARRKANAASAQAAAANGKADQALARPAVTPGGITTVTNSIAIAPNDFEVIGAVCPPGQRAISGGVTSVSGAGGVWSDHASDDRTAWIGGGEDLAGGGGTLTVYAYCTPAGAASIARRGSVQAELRELAREKDALR
jgi:hypothetical protein